MLYWIFCNRDWKHIFSSSASISYVAFLITGILSNCNVLILLDSFEAFDWNKWKNKGKGTGRT